MDAFESLMEMLLRREGYWTQTSVKVELTAAEKRHIGKPSSPRWEIDLVAYKGKTNEVLAIECKSYLDSPGVRFQDAAFDPPDRYKLFHDQVLRKTILKRLAKQIAGLGLARPKPKVTLCLAAGHIASSTDRTELARHMRRNGWRLFDEPWIEDRLRAAANAKYENDIAYVVAKIIHRKSKSAS